MAISERILSQVDIVFAASSARNTHRQAFRVASIVFVGLVYWIVG
ncbi:hypothetical protein [uncultured Desulfobacter sp.]|nr:hypothetical protein [uncultured Desulfobacter sp.]